MFRRLVDLADVVDTTLGLGAGQAPPVALLVGFDVAVARAVRLLIDRPIERYQNRLALPQPTVVDDELTSQPQQQKQLVKGEEDKGLSYDKLKDIDNSGDGGLTSTRTGTGEEGDASGCTGTAGKRTMTATAAAMKRRVLWDDCLGFLAHVVLPGRFSHTSYCRRLICTLSLPLFVVVVFCISDYLFV